MKTLGVLWAIAVAAFFALSIFLGIIERRIGIEVWKTRALAILGVIGFVWLFPLVLAAIGTPAIRIVRWFLE
jgi:threonine/homoserine efflux transporter RhtA